ncbi:DUF6612 family protein [Scopulibacillus cellulosilyticus]|uniref:DUF6612 family protein n=1 Tax=Scopulibacillus cellulosilyticus TaxID=2665665 RepID=A0ABW2Q0Y6_9BACL
MKKFLSLITGMILVIALSACSFGPKNANDVLEKAEKASKNIKSFKAYTVTDVNITEQGQGVSMRTKGYMNFQKNPVALYTNQTVESGSSINIQMYMTKDKIYIKNPSDPEMWLKIDNPDSEEFQQLAESQSQSTDIKSQLKSLKSHAKHFDFIEKNDAYVLKFNGSGKDFADFLNKMTEEQMANMDEQSQQILKNAKYNHVSFTYSFDKEKLTPKTMDMKADMTITNPGNSMEEARMKMNIKVKYSKFNNVKVSVPDKVKNNAQEILGPNENQDNGNYDSYTNSL